MARSCSTPPSPENPREASCDSISVNRIPGSTTSHATAAASCPAAIGAYTRRADACRNTCRRVSSRSGPGRQTAPGAGRLTGRRVRPMGTTQCAARAPEDFGSARSTAAASAAGTSARSSNPAAST
ncbi:hypothetical protein AB0I38_37800 [Nonomuraea cavernae]